MHWGWGKSYRFSARRCQKEQTPKEQYQLCQIPDYISRIFVTGVKQPIDLLVWIYRQRASAENLIKEANNDARIGGAPVRTVPRRLRALPVSDACVQPELLAGLLFNREEKIHSHDLKHATLVTARSPFLLVAAKIWGHAGRVGISYSDQYPERGLFERLMDRLRKITMGPAGFRAALATTLSCTSC